MNEEATDCYAELLSHGVTPLASHEKRVLNAKKPAVELALK
jgi:hypothetical protein